MPFSFYRLSLLCLLAVLQEPFTIYTTRKQVGTTLYTLTYRSGYSRFSPFIPAALYVIGHYDPRITVLYSFIIKLLYGTLTPQFCVYRIICLVLSL